MKLGSSFIIVICVNIVNSIRFDEIPEIQGNIKFIEFDSYSNIYVGCNNPSGAAFYKLTSRKQLIVKDISNNLTNIQKIFINSYGNAYIFDGTSAVVTSLFVLRHDASDIEKVYEFPLSEGQSPVYFMHNDHIYFNTAFGVAVLHTTENEKRGLTVPSCVDKLQYFSIASDSTYSIITNQIYLGGTFKGNNNNSIIAAISRDNQQGSVPSAEIKSTLQYEFSMISGVSSHAESTNDNHHTLISFSGSNPRIYRLGWPYREEPEAFQLIFGGYLHYLGNIYWINVENENKRRFYFFARNIFAGDCYLNFGNYGEQDDWEYSYYFSSIPKINFVDYDCERANFTSDSEGNIFFAMGKKKVFSLRYDEKDIKEIAFPTNQPEHEVTALLVDGEDNLLILAGDLFIVSKNTLMATKAKKGGIAAPSGLMKIEPKTKEIFIGSDSGLYVYSDY